MKSNREMSSHNPHAAHGRTGTSALHAAMKIRRAGLRRKTNAGLAGEPNKTTARLFQHALGWLFVVLIAGDADALSTDRDQPIELEADFAELDDRTGITVYKGNVIATQGSIKFTGDTLTIHYSKDWDLEKITLVGKPARFRQLMDGQDVYTTADALTIEYFAPKGLIVLTKDAILTQGEKIFKGHKINYDTVRNIIKARKATAEERKDENGSSKGEERIKVILPPVKKEKK